MKAVILAGGYGTRLSEETAIRPKPMVEIGGRPILWHIMKIYAAHGVREFIVCCGYKGEVIKDYFANYYLRNSDVTFDLSQNCMRIHQRRVEPWQVTVVDTGLTTMTGGRLRRIRPYLEEDAFCCTYGDGVSDVNVSAVIAFHRAHGKLATVTAVQPAGRFGILSLEEGNGQVSSFREKPAHDGGWINGGYFILNPGALDYIGSDDSVWEEAPLRQLAHSSQLVAYQHGGFWQPMDTLRDKEYLESLWRSGAAPWKVW